MTDINLEELAIGCASWSLKDSAWQRIGFRKCPRRGSLFVGLAPKWKIDLEKRILRELAFLGLSFQIIDHDFTENEIVILARKLSSNKAVPNLYEDYGYISQAEAVEHIGQSLNEYVSAGSENWSSLLIKRLELDSVPDSGLKVRITVNGIRLCAAFDFAIRHPVEKQNGFLLP